MEARGFEGTPSGRHTRPVVREGARFDSAFGEVIPQLWKMYCAGTPTLSRKNFHAAHGVEGCDARLRNGVPQSTSCGCIDEFQSVLAETAGIIKRRLLADPGYRPADGRSWGEASAYVFRTSAASNVYRAKRKARCALVNTLNLKTSKTYGELPDDFSRALYIAVVEAVGSLTHYSVDDQRPFHGYLAQRLAEKGLGLAPELLERIPAALGVIRELANRINARVRTCDGKLVGWWDGMVVHVMTDHLAGLSVSIAMTGQDDDAPIAHQLASSDHLVEQAAERRLAPLTLGGVDERVIADLEALPDDEASPILRVLLSSYLAAFATGAEPDVALRTALRASVSAGVLEAELVAQIVASPSTMADIQGALDATVREITG